jgi:hypothetical protein
MVFEFLIFLHDVTWLVDDLELKKFPNNRILGLKQYLAEGQSLSLPVDSWIIFIEPGKT